MFPETVLQDIRHAVRLLLRNFASTCLTVLALALGIGVNVAIYTAYQAMVVRPLDARHPEELANLALSRDSGAVETRFSYPDYGAYRDAVHSFSGLIAYRPTRVTIARAGEVLSSATAASGSIFGRFLRSGASNAESASVAVVSDNYFKVLGTNVIQGRNLESDHEVLISENYWHRRFSGDPSILGKTFELNGVDVTVVGITPHDFIGTGVGTPAFWLPMGVEPLINADGQWLHERENLRYRMFGRRASGAACSMGSPASTAYRYPAFHCCF